MLESVKNKILVLAAHPDDETLGCGGTISKLSKEGNDIHLITFTDGVGSRFDSSKNRNLRIDKVSEVLGIQKFNFGNFPDNQMDSVSMLDVCKFIESNVDYQPDIIFTHFVGDLNIDHSIVAKSTLTVFRPQFGNKNKIYSYYIPSSTDYNPFTFFDGNTYIEVSQLEVSKKILALKLYDEEMRKYPHARSYENVKNLMRVWGSEVGVEYSEKFKLVREIL